MRTQRMTCCFACLSDVALRLPLGQQWRTDRYVFEPSRLLRCWSGMPACCIRTYYNSETTNEHMYTMCFCAHTSTSQILSNTYQPIDDLSRLQWTIERGDRTHDERACSSSTVLLHPSWSDRGGDGGYATSSCGTASGLLRAHASCLQCE